MDEMRWENVSTARTVVNATIQWIAMEYRVTKRTWAIILMLYPVSSTVDFQIQSSEYLSITHRS